MIKRLGRERERVAAQLKKARLGWRLGERWEATDGVGARRVYADYATYLQHQRLKLTALRDSSIERHDRRFGPAPRERLAQLLLELQGAAVVCLAARQGTEVRAFTELGAFAVGIDLNPGPANRLVLTGDFHDLQFADGVVDAAYTNSMDHVFDPDRMPAEIRRVLKSGGVFVDEVRLGMEAGEGQGFYESFAWQSLDALLARIEQAGFRLEQRRSFELPWRGEQLLLRAA